MSSRTVFVTGGSGFIASHVIDQLLAKGYSVVATARSKAKSEPFVTEFQKKYPSSKLTFETVEDIAADDAFDEIIKNHSEITDVIHVASAAKFGLGIPIEEAYLKPAVNGTLNILKAVQKYAPQVTNFVVTASMASMIDWLNPDNKVVYTSDTWNSLTLDQCAENELLGYSYSKKAAEKAARKFVETEKVNFKLATIVPPLVVGPQVFKFSVTPELNVTNNILLEDIKPDTTKSLLPPGAQLCVDVRDIASFHILPLENEKLSEARELVIGGAYVKQSSLNVLNENFPNLKGKLALGDPESEAKLLEAAPEYDISELVKDAGNYKFIPIKQSIKDVFTQYFEVHPFTEK